MYLLSYAKMFWCDDNFFYFYISGQGDNHRGGGPAPLDEVGEGDADRLRGLPDGVAAEAG